MTTDYSSKPTDELVKLVAEKLRLALSVPGTLLHPLHPDRIQIEDFLKDLPRAHRLVKESKYPEDVFRDGF